MVLKLDSPVAVQKGPYYRIVVAEVSAPRDGRFVERLGSYNPMVPKDHPERLTLDGERATYWMSKGAKPTERVAKMMAGLGLVDAPEIREQPKKSASKSVRNVKKKPLQPQKQPELPLLLKPLPLKKLLPLLKPLLKKPQQRKPSSEALVEDQAEEQPEG